MGIRDDANSLDSALKRSTNSARSLSLAIAEGNNNLGHAVHSAAELAEALARASKVAKLAEMSTGIGLIVAAIGTIVAATVLWKDKQHEIAQQIRETHYATQQLNAQAQNNPRLAAEIKISAEKQKQLEAIEKEQKAMFGLGKVLHNYSGLIAAVNAHARAQLDELNASIARVFTRTRMQEGLQADMSGVLLDPRFVGSEAQEQEQNRLERLQAIRLKRDALHDQGLSEAEIESIVVQISRQFANASGVIRQNHLKPLGDSLGRSFASSIADGIAAGVRSGSIEEGFRHLTGGMLIGLGQMMVEIGTESLLAANLMNAIVSALKSFAPAGAIGPSLALIALGGIVMGMGAAMSGGGGGGGGRGGGGGGGGGSSSIPSIIDRGIIDPTSHSSMANGASLTPRGTFVYAPTQIGIDDARAHRDFARFKAAAKANGHDV